jgi:hypothetical protein
MLGSVVVLGSTERLVGELFFVIEASVRREIPGVVGALAVVFLLYPENIFEVLTKGPEGPALYEEFRESFTVALLARIRASSEDSEERRIVEAKTELLSLSSET